MHGRQPACLPDLEIPDFPEKETNTQYRQQRVRQTSIKAITQTTAVAKINRALKGKTTPDGAKLYKEGDLIDYYRKPDVKDEDGG